MDTDTGAIDTWVLEDYYLEVSADLQGALDVERDHAEMTARAVRLAAVGWQSRSDRRRELAEFFSDSREGEDDAMRSPETGYGDPEEPRRVMLAALRGDRGALATVRERAAMHPECRYVLDLVERPDTLAEVPEMLTDLAILDRAPTTGPEVVHDAAALDEAEPPLHIRPTLCPNGPNVNAHFDVTPTPVASPWASAA